MKRLLLIAAIAAVLMLAVPGLAVPGLALAQPLAPITATPLLPPSGQTSLLSQPPIDQASPPPQDAPKPAPQPMQQTWVPQTGAQLQVLDKVNAQNATLTLKVGQEAQFGSLKIQVQACNTHPPDQVQDSAAYLTITDSRTDAPGFRGWMLANNPALSMLQHPIYDVRVVACRT
ncbi:MAG: DUF2155 domain-containing protein [Acetobacteraceae bacterium]